MGRYIYFENGRKQFPLGYLYTDDLTYFGGNIVYKLEYDDINDFKDYGLTTKTWEWIYYEYDGEYHEESYYPDELNQMSEIWEGAIQISKNELDNILSKLVKFSDESCIELPNLVENDFHLYSLNVDVILNQQYNYINNSTHSNKWEKHRQNDLQAYGCYLYWFVKHDTLDRLNINFDIF